MSSPEEAVSKLICVQGKEVQSSGRTSASSFLSALLCLRACSVHARTGSGREQGCISCSDHCSTLGKGTGRARTSLGEAQGVSVPSGGFRSHWIPAVKRLHCFREGPSPTGLTPASLLTQSLELTSDFSSGPHEAEDWSLIHLLSQGATRKGRGWITVLSHFSFRSNDSWSLPRRGCLGT